jgi:endonuclease III
MVRRLEHLEEIFAGIRGTVRAVDRSALGSEEPGYPRSPFTTLISCLLSLRTKDEVTAVASRKLLSRYPTPEKLAEVSEEEICGLIYPVGFYKTKAKRIREISRTLLEKYHGQVPRDFDELLSLNGVGRKTANIVMVFGFHAHGYLPIDSHCHEISNRLGWVRTKSPEETEEALKKVLPEEYWDEFNELFVRFGQIVCVPVSPFCSRCPVSTYCPRVGVTHHR